MKVGDRIATPDFRVGTVYLIRRTSIVVKFDDGSFMTYEKR